MHSLYFYLNILSYPVMQCSIFSIGKSSLFSMLKDRFLFRLVLYLFHQQGEENEYCVTDGGNVLFDACQNPFDHHGSFLIRFDDWLCD